MNKATNGQAVSPSNFIIKVIEDKKKIVEALKKGKKLSSVKGIKIVSPL